MVFTNNTKYWFKSIWIQKYADSHCHNICKVYIRKKLAFPLEKTLNRNQQKALVAVFQGQN